MAARRTALLLDIGFGTLQGSARSCERIQDYLGRRDFEIAVLRGPEVTRARVSATLAGLRLSEGDSFVLYFVGHGERARGERLAATGGQAPPDTDVLLLLTHDVFDPSQPAPGIAGIELAKWLSPIVTATGNVTVILDCCRAATMTAGEAALDPAAQARVDATLARAAAGLRDKYPNKITRRGAPKMVCLVATTANEIAVERELADGSGRIGLFTDALVQVLDAHHGELRSWDELLPEIQDIVLRDCPTQRPGVEGQRHRVPFSRQERPPIDEYACLATRGGWVLHAGALHGMHVGDRFTLGPVTATAVAVDLDRATLRLDEDDASIPPISRARRVACAARDILTWPAGHDLPDTFSAALRAAPEIAIAAGVDAGPAGFTRHDDAVVLRDRAGAIVHAEPMIGLGHGAARLVAAARRLVRWERQRVALAQLSGSLVCAAFGRVGADDELPREGALLRAGDRLWVRAWGTGDHPEVFASLFHLRADRNLTHLGEALDHGVSVPRSRTVELARELAIPWSPHVPRTTPCDEALLVLTSLRPRALHRVASDPWEHPDQPTKRITRSGVDRPVLGATLFRYRLLP